MAETRVTQAGFHPPQDGQLTPIDEAPLARGAVGDAELLRVSVELARRFPRDEAAIMRKLIATIETFPDFASRALYSIPYKDGRGGSVNVEGLSVRAAETIVGEWGHFWVSASITGETDDFVDVQATAFDCQKNSVVRLPFRVSRFEKVRDSSTFRQLDDRRMLQALQSGISKARRNACLTVIPLHVREAFTRAVREALAGGPLAKPAEPTRVAAAVEAFQEKFHVTQLQLEQHVEKPRQLWNGRDLSDLRTLFNALDEGETTVAEAFPVEAEPVAQPIPKGTVTKVEEGMLGSAAPQDPRPELAIKMESQALKDYDKPAAPEPVETEADRLRREVAELQARLALATAPEAPPKAQVAAFVAGTVPAPKQPKATASPAAKPEIPTPQASVQPPAATAPQPAPSAASDDAFIAALTAEVEAAPTIIALDQILGRMYAPGGGLQGASRERKRVVLAIIGKRRDALQAAG